MAFQLEGGKEEFSPKVEFWASKMEIVVTPRSAKYGKYFWVLLANELAQAIAEWIVCAKFEENLSIIAISRSKFIFFVLVRH